MNVVASTNTPAAIPTGTVTRVTHRYIGGSDVDPSVIRQPTDATHVDGSFHDALQHASDMVHDNELRVFGYAAPLALRKNDSTSIAIYSAGKGAYELSRAGASIHLFDTVRAGKFVASSVSKPADSTLVGVVSWNRWADLRHDLTATSQPLIRIPFTGTVVAG